MADANEFSQQIDYLNGGPLEKTWGPYPTKEAACLAIENKVDDDGKNMRMGKTVAIGTDINYKIHRWIGGFKNENLKEDFSDLKNSFEIVESKDYLFDGAVDADLSRYIYGGAAPNVWMTGGGRCCIVPVISGEVIKVIGRDAMTSTKSVVWLTSNAHVVDQTPAFLTGSFSTSRFVGDGDYTVPNGASFLYVFYDIPKATIRVERLSGVREKYTLKDEVIQPATLKKIEEALQPSSIDSNGEGGNDKIASAEQLKAVKDNFESTQSKVYLFNGTTDAELNQSIYGGAAPNIWMTGGGRCCIVPVTADEVIRITGRDTMTSTKSIVWLTSNYHVIGEAPTFLTGSFSTSRFIGDGDYTVPLGAKFLYVFFDIPKSNVKVENVSAATEKFILKNEVIQPATLQKIFEALQPANIDVNAEGGSGKVAAADQLKAVKDKFESSPSTLFDGSKDTWLPRYIYGGGTEADKLWRDDVSSNIATIVAVIAGNTIEISGRELTGTKRNFWLTGANSLIGTKPDFRGGTFASATFLSDGQFVVPAGVTHLYVYAQTSSRLTVKIRNLTVRDLKLKDESLPDKIIQDISELQEQVGVVSNPGKLIIPAFVDVLINTDCNLYFDAITTIPDQLVGFNLISGMSTSGLVLRRERALKFKATDQQTNKLVSLFIRRPDWSVLDTKNFNIRTIPVTGLSGTVNLMVLGDSQAYNGASFIYAKLAEYTDITINRIGTVTSGGVKHEGRGGWEISDYLTNSTRGGFENPFFVNGTLNFNQYLVNTGQVTPDVVCFSVGGNDVGLGGTGIVTDSAIEAVIVKIKTFITAMSTAWPNTTIVLQTITPGGIRFNLSYNTGEYYKYNRMRASLRYVEEFDNGKFNPKVTVCCAGSWVDRENGYAYTLQQSADRIPDVQERVYSDPAHSNSNGYRQMADALASKIRAIKYGLL